jgi:glucoamylase
MSSSTVRKVTALIDFVRVKEELNLFDLQTFWNEEKGCMTETTITNVKTGGRSGVGAAPLTVSVLNFDPTLGCDPLTFQPCSDCALSSLKVVGDEFRELFPINQRLPSNQSPYFGFFLEDQLYGGQVR